ncbi:ATP-dependent zinc metalloprotease FtsH [Clostridium sp. D2Q-14]|nr:ATP-dependent zinc metalloprotease FtsH [Anaeromonas gelatinilytica]
MIFIIFSSFLIYDVYTKDTNILNTSMVDNILIWLITLSLLVYYIRKKHNPELVASSITTNKKSEEELRKKNKPNVSFNDVAGLDEVKEEMQEIIDFINNPTRFQKMGAKIPSGILFHGPPGTGKTLLAKALAGETNSNFLYSSGSEFVEKYVGVGAKRIRALFEKAKKDSPTIIFIDEIDAIGCKRNLDSNNEKDQTLNQLLVELDGFNKDSIVVVVGATNRLDLLDEALTRPGRFDRHIYIGNPNIKAREDIFKVHVKNKPIDISVNLEELSRKTHGFSGAQLANIANEAAILAVRKNKRKIDINDFNSAIERVVAGLEVKNPTVLNKEKEIVAHHEAGHAIVGKLLKSDMIQKISIIPRGQALGYVLKFPDDERYLLTEKELYNKIIVLLAGRAAEKVIFNEITTGAENDLKKATELATNIVCNYGMSSLGNMAINENYIRYYITSINNEVSNIIESCYTKALNVIEENIDFLKDVARYLIDNETMSINELNEIFEKNHQLTKTVN